MYQIIVFLTFFITSNCLAQPSNNFDGSNAYKYLKEQCKFGARDPGSMGHKKCLNYLTVELNKYADRVTQQSFSYPLRRGRKPVKMANIIANFEIDNRNRILLCAHWDTRPWADQDEDSAMHNKPVIGANDGASGVAVLLEIARLIHKNPPPYGIDIVLFDGEDYGSYGDNNSWAIGSRVFAQRKSGSYNPIFGILIDLIGDKNQEIYIEQNSMRFAPDIVNRVWKTAAELGIYEFIPEPRFEVMDDHVRLLEVGIKCINIIDFDYKYWHTIEDTPDKCSPQSLSNVGRVLMSVIYQ